MSRHRVPNFPYVEARNVGMPQIPSAIILTLSETTSEKGAALAIANYQHGRTAPLKSHHFVLDEDTIYRCIPDRLQAHSWPHRALTVHICAQPHEYDPLWDENGMLAPALRRAAELVADLSLAHRIRPVYLDEAGEKTWLKRRWRNRGGLMVRVRGSWPYVHFLAEVKLHQSFKQPRRKS